jgi:hypothetical protein
MPSEFLEQIDWRQPWLRPVKPIADRVLQTDSWAAALSAIALSQELRNRQDLPVSFVPQSHLPATVAYETFIYETGGVPTRDNLHDFFNGLVWLTFPRIKVMLNQLQANEIRRRAQAPEQARQAQRVRGQLRDAATIFDENAVLFLTSEASFSSLLRDHRWEKMFIEQRHEFDEHCAVYVFGHALMEKLVNPYKAITGHAWIVETPEDVLALPESARREWLDREVAGKLKDGLSTSDFSHLPVLGVPGWWPAQDEAFYADTSVFRPAKRR